MTTTCRDALDATPMITQWANMHDSIRAVLLSSTWAVPGAPIDLFSDNVVILVVKDIRPWMADHAWLSNFGEVLIAYWDPIHPDPLQLATCL